ncbi:MAG: excisionase family DNA-binding protein [Firmicutes bacterium]|nr:excisionase family DNA-binding protein [Bacillota bacterium]MBU4553735.1 excisionase family DNA-binding protein [Bacillota bacterium]MBV1728468.1 excisionase family DNA-binding protein [Desulforudis sp.]MBV1735757.1 excisionase family DNA-binding protein [Desulforudis sp.]MBV1770103.1 excisionase family DNA-binding protein [Desulforudis sp.]
MRQLRTDEKLLLSVEEAASLLGLSRSKFYLELDKGTFLSVRVGRSRRVPRQWLEDWVQGQIDHAQDRR